MKAGNPISNAAWISILAISLIFMSGLASPQRSLFDPHDLSVVSFEAVPLSDGGFDLEIVVKNTGPGTSDRTNILFWEEEDLIQGDIEQIGKISIPRLEEGKDYSASIVYEPGSCTVRRLWAVADPDPGSDEVTRSDNVASLLLRLPKITGVSSRMDGLEEEEAIGSYIHGIDVEIPLEITVGGSPDPGMITMFIEDEEGRMSRFVPMDPSGGFITSVMTSELKPGMNNFTVNSTYAKVPMERRNFSIITYGIPEHFDLEDRTVEFREDEGHYLISGYTDVPDSGFDALIDGMEDTVNMSLFKGSRDMLVSLEIGTDLHTSVSVEGGINISTEGDAHSFPFEIEDEISQPDDPFFISASATAGIEEWSLFDGYTSVEIELDDERTISVPLHPSPRLNVSFDISIGNRGGSLVKEAKIEIVMEDHTSIVSEGPDPGTDHPFASVFAETLWSSEHILSPGSVWENHIRSNITTNATIVESGLRIGDGGSYFEIPATGAGANVCTDPWGNATFSTIEKGSGHKTDVTVRLNDTEIRVASDNRYKSYPSTGFLPGGEPIVVWSNALDWSEDPSVRLSSMRIMFKRAGGDGSFSGNISGLSPTGNMQIHPGTATGYDGEVAAVWTEDMDSDPSTVSDTEIMASTFREGNWTEPDRITSDGRADDLAEAVYDPDGDLWVTWVSQGSAKVRKLDSDSGRWGLIRTFFEASGNTKIVSMDPLRGENGYPMVILSTSDNYDSASMEIWKGDPDSDELLQKGQTILSIDQFVSDVEAVRDREGRMLVSYRGQTRGKDSNLVLMGEENAHNTSWRGPLPLFGDGLPRWDLVAYPEGSGVIKTGYIETMSPPNVSGDRGRRLEKLNLSDAAVIEDVRWELLGDYNRWEEVRISVDVKNIGLDRDGAVEVILEREIRDPITGNISTYTVRQEQVIFTEIFHTRTVEFTTSLWEHQLRFVVRTGSEWGYPRAFGSSARIQMPVTSDPRVTDLSIHDKGEDPLESEVSVLVENFGHVTEDPMTVSVRGELGIPAGSHPSGEPNGTELLNRTVLSLAPDSDRLIRMNVTLRNGTNLIWVQIMGSDGNSVFFGPLKVNIHSTVKLSMATDEMVVVSGSDVIIDTRATNLGKPGTGSGNATVEVTVRRTGSEGNMTTFVAEMEIPKGGVSTEFHIPLGTLGNRSGVYIVRARMTSVSDPDNNTFIRKELSRRIYVLEPVSASISGYSEVDRGGTSLFSVNVSNGSNTTLRIARVVLFNGYPSDGIVMSEGFVLNVEPGKEQTVELPFDLDEGVYHLSITVSSPEVDSAGISRKETGMGMVSFDHTVTEEPTGDDVKEDVDMADVNDSILIGASSVAVVLLIAAIFKKKAEDEKEEDGD